MRFFHGSMDEIEPGTIMQGRGDEYEKNWETTDFYNALEQFRPKDKIAHKEGVFLCHHPDDVDLAGGGTDYLCEMKVLGRIQRHDMNWCTQISMLMCDDPDNIAEIELCAVNYWHGVPHPNESVWEYITDKAQVLSCEDYDTAFVDDETIPREVNDNVFLKFKKSQEAKLNQTSIKP